MKLLHYLKENSLFDTETYTYPEIMSDLPNLDMFILARFGMRDLQKRIEVLATEAGWTIPEAVQFLVYNTCVEKEYKWKTLLGTEQFEYNPIENYSSVENESVTRSKGSQENATVYGATHSTVGDAAHTDTSTAEISAENSSVYQPNEQTSNAYGATTTTSDANAHTDTFSEGSREDAETREMTRAGNIGTMSTQNMIGQEREIADFSALLIIAHDIVCEIGKGVC